MDPFLGEIRAFGFDFAPVGWALCNGQLLAISQNTALFAIIGTYYGGNGTSNFALPDLRGRVAVGQGQAPGLNPYFLGEEEGFEAVTLTASELPAHSHPYHVFVGRGANPENAPTANGAITASSAFAYETGGVNPPLVPMDPASIAPAAGRGLAHNNLMPYLAVSFCMCLSGVFPPRG
jgi:microcystin-dependent protein